MILKLKVTKREKLGKLKLMAKSDLLPGVFYGHKEKSTPIEMKREEFVKIWKEAGESTIVTLEAPDKNLDALIHDVSLDPISNKPSHVDFYVFEKGHQVEVSVPLEFVGIALAVKEKGAILMKVLHELKIKGEPTKLPHKIEVDISNLKEFGDSIEARDIALPSGVELEENPSEMVASVVEPKEEKEESIPVDLSQIEVEKKGKQDEVSSEESTNNP